MNIEYLRLSEIAQINPRRMTAVVDNEIAVTFVPMEAVDETLGKITVALEKPYAQVKKGYTVFADNDVIFAKVSPCMQNGKHAIARDLSNGMGFGSTEFHVVRAGPKVLPEWIHHFLRSEKTLDTAKKTFNGAVGLQRVPPVFLENLVLPVPAVDVQRQITDSLQSQLAAVETARQAARAQLRELTQLAHALVRESLAHPDTAPRALGEVLDEIKHGVGQRWAEFPVLGATRDGLAPAREGVGKAPERYKPVTPGTLFYNPMRILIGSIALLDDGAAPGITSPDYVVLRGRAGVVDTRWFYYWLRSPEGERCIASLARGAVRERMLFNRLAEGEIALPPYPVQQATSRALAELRPLKHAIETRLRDIERLPQRLLAQAFDFDEEIEHA